MRKIGLIIDSASGLSIKEANDRGHGFIPLQILVNEEESQRAGIEIKTEDLYELMKDKKNVTLATSLPNGKDIEAAFDWALERYEKAIYIGISHKMSGTQNAVKNIVQLERDKYEGKIFVYNSEYSSPWLTAYIENFEKLVTEYDDVDEIFKILDLANPYIYGLLAPGDIYWFFKGGRISKAAYMVGSLLKVTPILTIDNGELDKDNVIKARGWQKANDKMTEIIEPRVNELKEKGIPFKFMCIDSNNKDFTTDAKQKISAKYGVSEDEVMAFAISPEQTAHMGPDSTGVGIWVSLFDLLEYRKKEEN